MLDSIFSDTPWFTLSVAAVLYLIDVVLTLRERYLYFSGARDVIAMPELYPLNRPFDNAKGWKQLFDRRYVLYVVGMLVGVPLAWWVLVKQYNQPTFFLFGAGGLLLLELNEVIRLVGFNALHSAAKKQEGIQGSVEVTRFLFSNLYAIDMYGYALIYLLAFLYSGSLFFLGGAALSVTRGHAFRDFSIYSKWLKKRRGY